MDYKKLAEAPVFRGLSERFLENFIGRKIGRAHV